MSAHAHHHAIANERGEKVRVSGEPATVSLNDLVEAVEVVSAGRDNQAYVGIKTGRTQVIFGDNDMKDERPDDLETSDEYLRVANKRELGLGRAMVFAFVDETLRDDWDKVRDYFRKRGAYARFTDLLDRRDKREAWYAFDAKTTEDAWRRWCEAHGLLLVKDSGT
jgi:hypothetical protein